MSDFITKLTGLTQADVNKGIPYADACNKIVKEFGSRNKIWASWGDYDRLHVQRDCDFYDARYPFGRRHINCKTLFSLIYGLPKELGLAAALKYLDLDFKGDQHRGHDDAYNTARVLAKTIMRYR